MFLIHTFRSATLVWLTLCAAFPASASAAQSSAEGTKPEEHGANSFPAQEMPLVYDKENTGADVRKPPMPAFSALPSIPYLPDPFKKADGSRIAARDEWRIRRAEIKAILEHYDVGEKPGKPNTFEATLEGDTINLTVGEGDQTFNMTATINRPAGAPGGPIPAIIGINSPTGSLPANLFSKRGIADHHLQSQPGGSNRIRGYRLRLRQLHETLPECHRGLHDPLGMGRKPTHRCVGGPS